ncbi:GNAT family N-acetyltransferase [Deinococcus taeanensis]|uniref:GNAT family N-acetyltransferase n=1 Tax=Deinococcus taeanensis TaxID=2737050 RepID=UPI001CDD4BF8|nr:GNAT family N-acetyltransferase [Deinococcus taeanensis]UBV42588.1 GNAT family N-acetyltransferase [Deinococcus taeanensis]
MIRTDVQLRHVTDPDDPAVEAFGRVQETSYYAPDMLIPPEVFGHLITRRGPQREDRLLVAENAQGEVVGGTLYALLPLPGDVRGAGFNSFMAVTRAARGLGVGRALHAATLREVRAAGLAGMFADSVHPLRQDPADRAAEAATGVDPVARRTALHALGLRTVDLPYWQPVGGPDGGPLKDLDLLYQPLAPAATVPLALVTGVLRAYWTGWLGAGRAGREAQALADRAGNVPGVPLRPGTETASWWTAGEGSSGQADRP